MITIKRFTICMTLLLITAIGCMYWIYDNRQYEINHLQAEVNILWSYKLNEPFLKSQIEILQKTKANLQQQYNDIEISYTADKLYINKLESDLLRCEIYANTAELILKNNGINFVRNDD